MILEGNLTENRKYAWKFEDNINIRNIEIYFK